MITAQSTSLPLEAPPASDASLASSSSSTSSTCSSSPPYHPRSFTVPPDPLAALMTSQPGRIVSRNPLQPSGPICAFGSRLAFTYFPSPAPSPDLLNALTPGTTNSTSTAAGGAAGASGGGARSATDAATPTQAVAEPGVHWFTIDDQLVYLSFFQDYGPLNVGCLYRFCLHLHNLLEDPQHRHQRIFLYSSDEPDKKVNAALMMALYAMVVMRWSVADVLHPISCLELQPYRDAGYSRSDYHLHPQSILYGMSRALSHQLLDLSTFDLAAYEKAEKVEEGDWNWITPGFVAFASPVESGWTTTGGNAGGAAGGAGTGKTPKSGLGGRLNRAFRNVLDEFENKGVKVVVRLNKKLYDANHFKERGIDHVEMYFDDGTNPSMEMCREFIDLSDRVISAGDSVAVHCKAGLGRTGTLIGAYLIYKHGFTADEAIGFMRLMRPGSCVGPQQHFLYENQLEWVRWAAQDEMRAQLAQQRRDEAAAPSTTSRAAGGSNSTERAASADQERERSAPPRPITPPNEADLARHRSTTPHRNPATAPVTPRRQVVPGQPRKTPGRSRHGVAAPEVNSPAAGDDRALEGESGEDVDKMEDGTEEEQAMRDEAEMEGVVLSSPRKDKQSARGRKSLQLVDDAAGAEDAREAEDDPLALVSPKKLDLGPATGSSAATSTRPKTPAATSASSSTRPTRIARVTSQQRPLSAITDNRIVDRLRGSSRTVSSSSAAIADGSTGNSSSAQTIARSKGAKNLNTVFEAVEGGQQQPSQSRYPLRNTSGRTTPTAAPSANGSGLAHAPTVAAPGSPSKLPMRIPAKRGVAPPSPNPATQASHIASNAAAGKAMNDRPGFNPGRGRGQDGFSLAEGLAKLGGGNKGRNVRRRRSSMGSQDFVQAG
ncbi:hypothetical protein JCM10212_003684 [Sporobolomyces blumeae]